MNGTEAVGILRLVLDGEHEAAADWIDGLEDDDAREALRLAVAMCAVVLHNPDHAVDPDRFLAAAGLVAAGALVA